MTYLYFYSFNEGPADSIKIIEMIVFIDSSNQDIIHVDTYTRQIL